MNKIPTCVVIKKHRKCLYDNCNKQPSFGLEKLKPLYCSEHKLDNMKNVQAKTCLDDTCYKYSTVNVPCNDKAINPYDGYSNASNQLNDKGLIDKLFA